MSEEKAPVDIQADPGLTDAMKSALQRVDAGPAEVQKAASGLDALLAVRNLQATQQLPVDGAVFTMRAPGGSNYFKAAEYAGKNTQLVQVFESLLCVVAINGIPEATPNSRAMIDALADRVGRRALDSLAEWYQKTLYPEIDEAMTIAKESGILLDSPDFLVIVERVKASKLKK